MALARPSGQRLDSGAVQGVLLLSKPLRSFALPLFCQHIDDARHFLSLEREINVSVFLFCEKSFHEIDVISLHFPSRSGGR